MSSVFWVVLLLVALTLANGFFNAAEIALISARRGRLAQLAENGDRKAKLALDLASNPNRFLPAVQICITLIGVFTAALAGANLENRLAKALAGGFHWLSADEAHYAALTLVTIGVAGLQLILGELAPKRLAMSRAEAIARQVAPLMSAVGRFGKPAIWLMGKATDAVLIVIRAGETPEPSISVHDIEHLIDTGTAEGVLQPVEQKVAIEALRLGDHTVRDVMRPRIDLDALDVDTPAKEVIGAAAMAGFSRLPVYERDLDHIIGFVHIKDLFLHQYLGWPLELRKMLHPPLFVPQTVHLDRLLEMFQEKHTQLAVVLDEYGGTQGIVTLEDVIEELVGEIKDEHRHDQQQQMIARPDGSWLVDGQVSLDDMLEKLHMPDPEPTASRAFTTVSGLILERLGRIPNVGDLADWHGLHLEVVDMDGPRIDRVLVGQPRGEAETDGRR